MKGLSDEVKDVRRPCYDIEPLFVNRWSPRAMTGEPLDDDEFMPLFEAARWAPSSFNEQPWRFLYAKRDTEHWETFLDLLVDANKTWAKNAALLAVVISKKTFTYNGKPNKVHVYDSGSAWENLALEGSRRGLVVHGMAGFDFDKTREKLSIPSDYSVNAMLAIGKPAKKDILPKELQEHEVVSDRKPLKEILMEGGFRE